MQITVLGPTGSLGSHICVELLNRGHDVVGVSRSPEKLGQHERYRPVQLDISTAGAEPFIEVFKAAEVVIWAYNTQPSPDVYRSYLEILRRVLQAIKALSKGTKVPYFLMVGGTGSLELPDRPFDTALDDRKWWILFQRNIADSAASTAQTIEHLGGSGPIVERLKAYRSARQAVKGENATQEHLETIKQIEDSILFGENPYPDIPRAARAGFMMFEGNTSFKWTFLSPPTGYRPGEKSGKYEIWFDRLPTSSIEQPNGKSQDESDIGIKLLGITMPDLALAIVDEAERQEKAWKHWSAVGDLGEDKVVAGTVRI